jgi:hypothetical protein
MRFVDTAAIVARCVAHGVLAAGAVLHRFHRCELHRLDGLLHGLLSIGVELQSNQVLSVCVWPALGANGDARITLPEFVDAMDTAAVDAMEENCR